MCAYACTCVYVCARAPCRCTWKRNSRLPQSDISRDDRSLKSPEQHRERALQRHGGRYRGGVEVVSLEKGGGQGRKGWKSTSLDYGCVPLDRKWSWPRIECSETGAASFGASPHARRLTQPAQALLHCLLPRVASTLPNARSSSTRAVPVRMPFLCPRLPFLPSLLGQLQVFSQAGLRTTSSRKHSLVLSGQTQDFCYCTAVCSCCL